MVAPTMLKDLWRDRGFVARRMVEWGEAIKGWMSSLFQENAASLVVFYGSAPHWVRFVSGFCDNLQPPVGSADLFAVRQGLSLPGSPYPQRGINLFDKSSSERCIQTLALDFKYSGHTWGKTRNFVEGGYQLFKHAAGQVAGGRHPGHPNRAPGAAAEPTGRDD